jgi:hypothetical protein
VRQQWLRRLDATRPEGASPLGWRCFQLGLLLLASSALLAGVLLLVALILGCRQRLPWWRDRVNQVLLLVSVLMVLGCFTASSGWLAWVGLGNWLPFFWAFWGYQPYLASAPARRRVALWLVVGSVPVIVTGLGQLFLGWSGPFQILGGAVIWHLKAGGNPSGRLAGLFDYANIAGAWLALAWPFALAALLQRPQPWRKRLPALLISVGLVAAMALTDSRNAWGALVLALPLVAGPARWIWLLPLLLLLIPVGLASLPGVPLALQQPARVLVPVEVWERLSDLEFAGRRPLAITRVNQWGVALQLVAERPWLGWGAAAFSVIYPLRTAGIWHGHPHNLPIDLAVSHGAPVAVLLVGLVLALQIQAARRGMASGALFERAWWAAFLVLMALHATDIPLYDSRINIAGWVLLCGLRAYSLSPESRQRG